EMVLEVGTNELVLAAEGVVQRGLSDAGPLHNPVDSDHMNTFGIEQVINGREQAVPNRQLVRSLGLAGFQSHLVHFTDRSVYHRNSCYYTNRSVESVVNVRIASGGEETMP